MRYIAAYRQSKAASLSVPWQSNSDGPNAGLTQGVLRDLKSITIYISIELRDGIIMGYYDNCIRPILYTTQTL